MQITSNGKVPKTIHTQAATGNTNSIKWKLKSEKWSIKICHQTSTYKNEINTHTHKQDEQFKRYIISLDTNQPFHLISFPRNTKWTVFFPANIFPVVKWKKKVPLKTKIKCCTHVSGCSRVCILCSYFWFSFLPLALNPKTKMKLNRWPPSPS